MRRRLFTKLQQHVVADAIERRPVRKPSVDGRHERVRTGRGSVCQRGSRYGGGIATPMPSIAVERQLGAERAHDIASMRW